MKKQIVSFLAFLMMTGVLVYGQELKTTSFKVYGSCEECKARIEKAANSVAGVTNATWSIDTKMMKISFNQSKTSSDEIQKAIANVGHDTEKFKADDKTYNALPACCQYERSKN
jgi:mercuric ion binding protein